MARPNTYTLGGNIDVTVTPTDQNDDFFIPAESRLSIKQPDGTIITVSGGGDLIVASGYMYYRFKPPTRGWYETESWVKDAEGKERAAPGGFEIVDRLYP